MKKVSYEIDVRALGRYEDYFYVDDDASDEQIKDMVDEKLNYWIDYKVDDGYEPIQKTIYEKRL